MNVLILLGLLVIIVLLVVVSIKNKENLTPLSGMYDNMILADDTGSLSYIHFPRGAILLWYTDNIAQIPTGWALCDGKNGTPDLRGKIPIGVNPTGNQNPAFSPREFKSVGGGETTQATLSTANLPAHTHEYRTGNYAAVANQTLVCDTDVTGDNLNATEQTGSTGNSTPFTVTTVPPLVALAYIMKIV